jgi:[acyl-carrier-protein] S-malonyltransferase
LAAVPLRPLQAGLVANVSADLVADVELERRLLVGQVTAPVRWTDTLRRLADLGVARFVEFGSGQVLTGLVGRTLEGASAVAVVDPDSLKEAIA